MIRIFQIKYITILEFKNLFNSSSVDILFLQCAEFFIISGEDLVNRINIHLVFDGVDTVAEVQINDVVIGKMQNMFRQYVFDIKQHVKASIFNKK